MSLNDTRAEGVYIHVEYSPCHLQQSFFCSTSWAKLKFAKTLVILCLLLSCFAPQPVFANAGPTFWQGVPPPPEVLVIDENCPVEVAAETLLFRFGAADSSRSYTMGRAGYSFL